MKQVIATIAAIVFFTFAYQVVLSQTIKIPDKNNTQQQNPDTTRYATTKTSSGNVATIYIPRRERIEEAVDEMDKELKTQLADNTKEMIEQEKITDNVQLNVKAEVEEEVNEFGEEILNLKLEYEYTVVKAKIENQTDDYPPGEYNLMKSNAAKLTMTTLKQTVENQLVEYLGPGKIVTIKITGSTDATPIAGTIPYNNDYGEFFNEFYFINGSLDNITITKDNGIQSNAQLAFLRTYGVRYFIENFVGPLSVTQNKFEHFAIVSDKQGSEYRRISVEMIIHNAFEGKFQEDKRTNHTYLAENSGSGTETDDRKVTFYEDITRLKDSIISTEDKYYALIIGISNYADPNIPSLDNETINDAKKLSNILTTYYTFNSEDITFLQDPTYKQIIRAFDDLSKKINSNDNLLIFYAGHGYFDENNNVGYWLASDAEYAYTDAWLYNSTLVDNISKIQSKHTLLISDACFSGSIYKTRALPSTAGIAYQKKYELKSRNAITSGTLKTVPNKSVFFKYLCDRLIYNDEPYLSASELYRAIEIPVGNNSPNTPQFGDIQNVGDEGGDFIFIKRKQ
jgi:hypothetical protein